jgi:3',5'-cyclic AMP phosphodiesterase CpdA
MNSFFYGLSPYLTNLSTLRSVPLFNFLTMISSDTPYKLVEIIHDTWPNLYRPMKMVYNNERTQKKNDRKD